MTKKRYVPTSIILLLIISLSILGGFNIFVPTEYSIIDPTSAQSNQIDYLSTTLTDQFNTLVTGYDPSLWHAVQRGNGGISSNGESITLDSESGGYQFLKSRRKFDVESTATIATRTSMQTFEPHVFWGWSSSIPGYSTNYDWNLENTADAIYITNLHIENFYMLVIRKDHATIASNGFSANLNEFSTVFMSWSSNGIVVKVEGEEVVSIENGNDLFPTSKMYYYMGIRSSGLPDANNNLEITETILQGPTPGSDMPIFVNPSNGYMFIEGNPNMTVSWSIDDDDPNEYAIWLGENLLIRSSWSSNELILYTLDNLIVGIYELTIQVWDATGNSIVNFVNVKILESQYFINYNHREDFDGPTLAANWVFHEVQGSTVEFQDGSFNFAGGGVAVVEHLEPRALNRSLLVNIAMREPVTHGGSGFGLSNYDFTAPSFTQGDKVFSPFIESDASEAIYVRNSGDGSHYRLMVKNNAFYYDYDFYLDGTQKQDFLLVRNINGIELYVSNILIYSFDAREYVLPISDLFFSSFATSWARPSLTELNYYQVQNDTTNVTPASQLLDVPIENRISFTLPSENIIDTLDITDSKADDVKITTTDIIPILGPPSEELDLKVRSLVILGLVVVAISSTIVLTRKKLNLGKLRFNKLSEEGLNIDLEGFETDVRPNVLPFSGLCAKCGILPKIEDAFCTNCGTSFQ